VLDGNVYTLGDCGGDHQVDLLELSPDGHGEANPVGPVGDCSMASASALAGFLTADSGYLLIGCQGESPNGGLYALKAGSSVLVPLSTPLVADLTPSAEGGESAPGGVLLDGNTLYLASQGGANSSGPSSTPSVLALDLDTGKTLWSHQFPGATDVAALTANTSGVLVAVVESTAVTASVQALSHTDGSVTATRALNPPEEAPFNALNTNVEAPYAVAVGSHVSVAFPAAEEPGQILLGTMTAP
jgi:outer membrane protein assembly factor BamB